MSICNLKESIDFVYFSLENKIIIKCICLTELLFINRLVYTIYDINFAYFICDKVKIITIYDIHKNIINNPIQINLFKYPIKINEILENLKEKNIYFFKTYIGAYILYNKINNIKYHSFYDGFLEKISYDNIECTLHKKSNRFTIKDNIWLYKFCFKCNIDDIDLNSCYIFCYYNNNINIEIFIRNAFTDNIELKQYSEDNVYRTSIIISQNLKIHKIEEWCIFTRLYYEKRNDNNEIIMIKEYDDEGKLKKEFISNNKNPHFSKILKKKYIELINYYNNNIIKFNKQIIYILKKNKNAKNNLLFNYILENIF